MSHRMNRRHYADMFGPTTGDKVRLGDTSLILEVEKDHTIYGDECKFGGGKVIREGMGQAAGVGADGALDCVITNALVVDYTGIYKADIGIKHGLISGHRQGGQSRRDGGCDSQDMIVGVTTEVIAGEGLIVTAGGLDTHIHFICPQQAHEAIAAGLTTMIGGGTGPGGWHLRDDLHARAVLFSRDAAGGRFAAAEFWFHRQRQHGAARWFVRSDSRRRDRTEAARRLGHDARRD